MKAIPANEDPVPVVTPVNVYVVVALQLSVPVTFQPVPTFVYVQTPPSVFTFWFPTNAHEINGNSASVTTTL